MVLTLSFSFDQDTYTNYKWKNRQQLIYFSITYFSTINAYPGISLCVDYPIISTMKILFIGWVTF